MSNKVVVRDLRKNYGAIPAVRGISFHVAEGEIFGLLGPNGAGKTTTTECIVGLREPDSGSIEVCGVDMRSQPSEARQKIGAALQTTSLQDKITPREALKAFGAFYRQSATPQSLLDRFQLNPRANSAFDTLSGGERQRLALALAFVNKPELVFLDEPTVGLDPQSRRDLHAEILRMKNEGHTVLLTTHHMDEASRLCDRLAIIHHGLIVATGTPRELVAQSKATPEVFLVTETALDPALFHRLPGIVNLRQHENTVRFRTATPTAALAAILNTTGIQITELSVRKTTLEDVFLELTGDHLEGDPA